MFVVIQFPVADGRAFASGSGVVERPDWGAPKISPLLAHRDFVRGFGRLAYRRKETSAAWVDEDFFAYAKRAVQFPTLQQRHFEGQGGGRLMVRRRSRWMVSCRFRRLFCDGEATVRLEVGFAVTPDYEHGKVSPEEVVRQLLRLPAVVPGGWSGNATKDLMLLGPYIARRYAQASTRHGWNVAATERFLAEREARRPTFNVSGRVVHVGDQIFSGQFYGPVAGTVYAEKMQNSFNSFASRQPDDDLRSRVAELHEQVADLVGRLKEVSPDEANEVADTLASFTEEVGKDKPNKVTLRALGNGLMDVAQKVAELTVPIATAVTAVLKAFGIAAL
jgi:hypothetical protein